MGTSPLLSDSPGNSCDSIVPKGWSLGRSGPLPGAVARSCSAWSRGACPSPEWPLSLPEPQSVGPRGATLPWGRPEDPGLQEVPALCFCQLGLPALPAKWPVQRGHFLASDVTHFCGNAGGLKGPLFPQDNRSLVPLTMPFSFPECTRASPAPALLATSLHRAPGPGSAWAARPSRHSSGQWLVALVLFRPPLFSQGDLGLEDLVTLA